MYYKRCHGNKPRRSVPCENVSLGICGQQMLRSVCASAHFSHARRHCLDWHGPDSECLKACQFDSLTGPTVSFCSHLFSQTERDRILILNTQCISRYITQRNNAGSEDLQSGWESVFKQTIGVLTHCRLNRLSYTIYWKSPISILGRSGYEIYIFLEKNG